MTLRLPVSDEEIDAIRLALPLFGFAEVAVERAEVRRIRFRGDEATLELLGNWWAAAAWRDAR